MRASPRLALEGSGTRGGRKFGRYDLVLRRTTSAVPAYRFLETLPRGLVEELGANARDESKDVLRCKCRGYNLPGFTVKKSAKNSPRCDDDADNTELRSANSSAADFTSCL
jgi:hypothetical protein